MTFVADACTIILLAKARVLESFLDWKKIVISKTVYNEVMKGKEKKFFDALLVERLYIDKKVIVIDVKNKKMLNKLKDDFGLGDGEAETIAIYLEGKFQGLITDNKQGRKTAKIYNIDPIGSPDIVISLFKAKKISKEKVINALNSLRKYGWFEDSIIDYALLEVENG